MARREGWVCGGDSGDIEGVCLAEDGGGGGGAAGGRGAWRMEERKVAMLRCGYVRRGCSVSIITRLSG